MKNAMMGIQSLETDVPNDALLNWDGNAKILIPVLQFAPRYVETGWYMEMRSVMMDFMAPEQTFQEMVAMENVKLSPNMSVLITTEIDQCVSLYAVMVEDRKGKNVMMGTDQTGMGVLQAIVNVKLKVILNALVETIQLWIFVKESQMLKLKKLVNQTS